jgi:outer membrane receptor for ferrienterochelin and colicins
VNAKFSLSDKWGIRLAYAYGFRAPALRELYFDFHDANHDIIGNPDLKAEYSNSFSGSLSYTASKDNQFGWVITLAPFYNQFNNLISYAQSATNPSQFVTVNIDEFKTTGATLESKTTWKNLDATLGLGYIGRYNAFSDVEQYKDENLSTFTWTPEVNANIIYNLRKIGTSLSLFYKFAGERPGYSEFYNNTTGQYEVGLTKIDSYHWADLIITKAFKKYITISGGVKNLFDVTDLNTSSADPGGTHSGAGLRPMGYGRSYFLGLALQWSKN